MRIRSGMCVASVYVVALSASAAGDCPPLHTGKLVSPEAPTSPNFFGGVAMDGSTMVVGAPAATAIGGAAYVYRLIEGSWVYTTKLVPSDASNGLFGNSVAVYGTTIVVGARFANNRGAAYVFVQSGGVWSQQAKLVGSDTVSGDDFGYSVAAGFNTIVVGAPGVDDACNPPTELCDSGAAYVFFRSGTSWSQQARFVPADGGVGGYFGRAVALSGNTALVGAPNNTNASGSRAGTAYVYQRSGSTWSLQASIVSPVVRPFRGFGASLTLELDTAVIGNVIGDPLEVYQRSGTAWTRVTTISSGEGVPLGTVRLVGGVLVAGAPTATVKGQSGAGAAYVFRGAGSVWARVGKMTSPDPAQSDGFGASVGLGVDRVVIGEPQDDQAGSNAGAVHTFFLSPLPSSMYTASDGASSDAFGTAVACDGETMIAGSPGRTGAQGSDVGAAYVFRRSGGGWSEEAVLLAADGGRNSRMGEAVGLSDGLAIIGAPLHSMGGNNREGAAYVFARSGSTWTQESRLTAADAARDDQFGASVAIEGDVAVVGAPGDDFPGANDRGSAYVFGRIEGEWVPVAKLVAPDGAPNDWLGSAVAVHGDKIALGAPGDSHPGASGAGSVYVFRLIDGAWELEVKLIASNAASGDRFGAALSFFGTELMVGADQKRVAGVSDAGAAYIFVHDGVWLEQAMLSSSPPQSNASLGRAVYLGDGFALAGAWFDESTGSNTGAIYRFDRNGEVWTQRVRTVPVNAGSGDRFGYAVAGHGRLAFVGAPFDAVGSLSRSGSVYEVDMIPAPSIVAPPIRAVVCPRGETGFEVVAEGAGSLTYQWRRNGANLSDGVTSHGSVITGSGTPLLLIENAAPQDAGGYSCEISNACGAIVSASAPLVYCVVEFNCDGQIDFFDYLDFVEAFAAGC